MRFMTDPQSPTAGNRVLHLFIKTKPFKNWRQLLVYCHFYNLTSVVDPDPYSEYV